MCRCRVGRGRSERVRWRTGLDWFSIGPRLGIGTRSICTLDTRIRTLHRHSITNLYPPFVDNPYCFRKLKSRVKQVRAGEESNTLKIQYRHAFKDSVLQSQIVHIGVVVVEHILVVRRHEHQAPHLLLPCDAVHHRRELQQRRRFGQRVDGVCLHEPA